MKPDHAKGRGPNPSDRAMERLEELGKTDLPMFRFNRPDPDAEPQPDPEADLPVTDDTTRPDTPSVSVDEYGVPIFDLDIPDADDNWDLTTPDLDYLV